MPVKKSDVGKYVYHLSAESFMIKIVPFSHVYAMKVKHLAVGQFSTKRGQRRPDVPDFQGQSPFWMTCPWLELSPDMSLILTEG